METRPRPNSDTDRPGWQRLRPEHDPHRSWTRTRLGRISAHQGQTRAVAGHTRTRKGVDWDRQGARSGQMGTTPRPTLDTGRPDEQRLRLEQNLHRSWTQARLGWISAHRHRPWIMFGQALDRTRKDLRGVLHSNRFCLASRRKEKHTRHVLHCMASDFLGFGKTQYHKSVQTQYQHKM